MSYKESTRLRIHRNKIMSSDVAEILMWDALIDLRYYRNVNIDSGPCEVVNCTGYHHVVYIDCMPCDTPGDVAAEVNMYKLKWN